MAQIKHCSHCWLRPIRHPGKVSSAGWLRESSVNGTALTVVYIVHVKLDDVHRIALLPAIDNLPAALQWRSPMATRRLWTSAPTL